MPNFSDIVEEVTSLETEQMEEIKVIISKVLIEKKRELILKNHQEAVNDAAAGNLFTSDDPIETALFLKNL